MKIKRNSPHLKEKKSKRKVNGRRHMLFYESLVNGFFFPKCRNRFSSIVRPITIIIIIIRWTSLNKFFFRDLFSVIFKHCFLSFYRFFLRQIYANFIKRLSIKKYLRFISKKRIIRLKKSCWNVGKWQMGRFLFELIWF